MTIQSLKDETAIMIIDAVKFAVLVGVNATDCGIHLSTSLYLNIRDAMFHYKALCDCGSDEKLELAKRQYYNLKEHIIRGEKDAVISHAHAVNDAVFDIMQLPDFYKKFDIQDIKQLQAYTHGVKNIILKVRLAGTDLNKDSSSLIQETWEEMVEYTLKIAQLCQSKDIHMF